MPLSVCKTCLKHCLGKLLLLRWRRTQEVHSIATETYLHLAEEYEGTAKDFV